MIEKRLTIVNPLGLHARTSMALVHLAERYQCRIELLHHQRALDLKDIFHVMSLAAKVGDQLTMQFIGEDEVDAAHAIEQLFAEGFGELDFTD